MDNDASHAICTTVGDGDYGKYEGTISQAREGEEACYVLGSQLGAAMNYMNISEEIVHVSQVGSQENIGILFKFKSRILSAGVKIV